MTDGYLERMVPPWLNIVSIIALAVGGATSAWITTDLLRHPQKMAIMNVVWPITALYLGPIALPLYYRYGRMAAKDATPRGDMEAAKRQPDPIRRAELRTGKPFWALAAIGVTHCGAGCTLGDIIAETSIFFGGLVFAGSLFGSFLVGDYILAYLLGIVFQYFAIAPMRNISGIKGIWAAVKADTLSLTAFEVGLFAWMWAMHAFVRPELKPDQATYWFGMQTGMTLGFLTAYPVNWWLIRSGVKEAM